ncbi:uncharacterized protein RSE6_12589 [Rhynchosporium secalis]|uniref:Uncharacterized protein n=1 Tax=Rhynchosporium secalis TaxID=38038 RepID=A0A1E1MQU3_RHYSE|nr:uncharacterized protein RSE6_12589 [Rhynchosporium secalis]
MAMIGKDQQEQQPRPELKKPRSMVEIFTAEEERREMEAIREEKTKERGAGIFLRDLAVQEKDRLKEAEAEWKLQRWAARALCARCEKGFVKGKSGSSDCEHHPGVLGRYEQHLQEIHIVLWSCCRKDPEQPGCAETHHVDDSLPSDVSKLKRGQEAGQLKANFALHGICQRCVQNFRIKIPLTQPEIEATELRCDDCKVFAYLKSGAGIINDIPSTNEPQTWASITAGRNIVDLTEDDALDLVSRDRPANLIPNLMIKHASSTSFRTIPGPVFIELLDESD